MKVAALKMRNDDYILELHLTFRERIARVIARLESQGFRPRIQDAWRSPEQQKKAFDSGHSQLVFGFHNTTTFNGTPDALAVDMTDDNSPLKPSKPYLLQLAAAAEAEGLTTGIRWGLDENLSGGVDAAIASQDWKANVKIGWDPTHVQPTDITVDQAKSGLRPA